MTFLAELKKRRVFRVAGSYVIVAWLLIQVADIFFPALKLPDWSVTLVAGMVILGFPVAILLAWAYPITPEGVVRSSLAADVDGTPSEGGNRLSYLILGLLVVGLLVFDRFMPDSSRAGESRPAITPTSGGSVLAGVVPQPDNALPAPGIAAIGFDGPLVALSPNGRWLV